MQVETAIVPSFETALSESEWQQAQEERRQAEEAAAEGEAMDLILVPSCSVFARVLTDF